MSHRSRFRGAPLRAALAAPALLALPPLTVPAAAQLAPALLSTTATAAPAPAAPGPAAPAPAAPAAAAPAPAAPRRRPDYLPMRFDERWPAARDSVGRDPFDALKHVPLLPGDRAYVTLGGQYRVRGEEVSHFMLGAGDDRSDTYGGVRLLLSADAHAGPVRVFGEVRDAVSIQRDLPGGTRPNDEDRWDVQNLFGEVGGARGRARGAVRVGRQELAVGRERLVGIADWANSRRAFEGVRATGAVGRLSADAFWARPVQVRQTERNVADTLTTLRGATLGATRGTQAVQLYVLDLDQRRATLSGVTGTHRRVTTGARASGRVLAPWLTYELEGARQLGHLGTHRVRSGFLVSQLTGTAARLPLSPSVNVGYDVGSGDRDSTDRVLGTFHQLFPSPHGMGGVADVFSRLNTREAYVGLGVQPSARTTARVTAHRFDRASLADGAYAKNSALLRAADGGTARALGSEFDLLGTYAVSRHLRLQGGYAHVRPGAFVRAGGELTHAVDWAYLTTTFTF